MALTPWSEVIEHRCVICDGLASHIYGDISLCCQCHAQDGVGLISREQAECMHQHGHLPEDTICDGGDPDGTT